MSIQLGFCRLIRRITMAVAVRTPTMMPTTRDVQRKANSKCSWRDVRIASPLNAAAPESDAAANLGDVAFLFEHPAAFSTSRLVSVTFDGGDVSVAVGG